MRNYHNVIYVLTNPLYAGYIKIGYASDLAQRLATLNTGMLRNFEPYCVYETSAKNADRDFHAIIDDLAPIVRARVINGQKVQDKEFFKLEPEQAYDLLRHIAQMTGTEARLHRDGDLEPEMPPASPYVQQTPEARKNESGKTFHRSSLHHVPKPALCVIGNDVHEFTSWKDAGVWQCEKIISRVGFSAFKTAALAIKLTDKKSKRSLFSETEEGMRGFSFYKFSEGSLYLLTNYSATSWQKIYSKLAEMWPECQMTFEYDEEKA